MAASFDPKPPAPPDPYARRRRGLRRWLRLHSAWLGLTAGLLALVAVMTLIQPMPRFDRILQDAAGAAMAKKAGDDIVIVEIDDKTLNAIGRFPWRRALHAELLRRIGAQAPRCIGLDILMTEPDADHPGDDAVLADAMLDNGCVVLPMAVRKEGSRALRELLPEPRLAAAAAAIGHAHLSLDEDGIARSAYLREGFEGRSWPHFALALKLAAQARADGASAPTTAQPRTARPDAGPVDQWLRTDHEVLLFADARSRFRRVSYIDVLRDAVPPDVFRGRIVLVGATAPGLGNVYATPSSNAEGLLPGIEIFANVLEGLLVDRHVMVARPWQDLIYNLVPLFIALLGLLWLRPVGVIALILAMLLMRFGLNLARPWIGLQLAPAAGFAGLLLVYPLWSLLRLTAAVRYLRWGTEELLVGLEDFSPPRLPRGGGDFLDRQMAITAAAGRRMRDLHRFVRDGIDHLPDATMILDASGRVLIDNQTARQRWRGEEDGLAGQDAHALLGDILWRGKSQPMMPQGALKTTVKPILGEGEDSQGRAVLMRCVPFFDDDNEHAGWMVALVDITRMRQAQTQRDEALRFISHDIREPSAAILTIIELARTHPEALSDIQALSRIERHAHNGLALADGFVNLARAEAAPFRAEVLDLVGLGLQVMDDGWASAAARGVQLRSGYAPEEALCIGDRGLITRAMANILSNAIKFSPKGAQVNCSITARGDQWLLSVRDQGPGIPVELQSQLFQPFHRLHRESHPETHGVGLGLLLVRTVAQRHGGAVEIVSAAGGGCAVTIVLPRPSEAEIEAASLPKE